MCFSKISLSTTLRIITITLGVLMAFFFLLFGIANLINPDVPDDYLNQNTRVCVMLIITGVVSIYALFRPYSGGILLCIIAVSFGFIVYSTAILILAVPILLLGVLFFIRGRLSRKKVSEETDQPS